MKTLVQFGAGNIGRSLVGQIFSRAGYEVVFVDVATDLIDALNTNGRYLIRIKDDIPAGCRSEVFVEHVRGIAVSDTGAVSDAVRRADLIATAVGAKALPDVIGLIARGLENRTGPVSIIMCENAREASAVAREVLCRTLPSRFDIDSRVGLVETSIGKMVPIMPADVREKDPLEVWAEAYNRIIADREGFVEEPPAIEGLVLKRNFRAHLDRKLFVHNLGHAASAYHGYLAGMVFIRECVEARGILDETRATMWEAGNALIKRYASEFDRSDMAEHIEDLLRRFGNRALGDTVYRVGRDLVRKLSPPDRCLGALRLITSQGSDPKRVVKTIAAALCFKAADEHGDMFPADEEFHSRLDADGPEVILVEVCGLDRRTDRRVIDTILREYDDLKKTGG